MIILALELLVGDEGSDQSYMRKDLDSIEFQNYAYDYQNI